MIARSAFQQQGVRTKEGCWRGTCAHGKVAPARGSRRATVTPRAVLASRPSNNGGPALFNGNGKPVAHHSHAVAAPPLPGTPPASAPSSPPVHEHPPLVGLPGNTYEKIMDCVRYVRARSTLVPEIAIVLGSGLGALADDLEIDASIPYADIPHFHAPGVVGHPGRLVLGRLSGVPALVLQGRFHYYEGHPMDEVILPIRMAKYLGCHSALITNAAGGINPSFRPGDLMLIEDHINMIGSNPLRGPNPAELGGPRFLDLSAPYDEEFSALIEDTATELGLPPLRRGVYVGVSGPTYETRAEVRFFRSAGADAVGMSTVPEVIAARHLGVRVAALSCVTNLACGLEEGALSHDDVMAQGAAAAEGMRRLMVAAVPRIAAAARSAATKQAAR